ncbi:hypothetical protein BD311DRAFT_239150 [Dichomitus squalens]|uniref:Uncharacterized protein n=1 Tax=Dichomitus squalens TaxID=114155 RepID=A0A4Q9MR86_9APHY|nr:hypothetical protein BD311DRAFT_239150 [Dichomitus squalens]
MIRAGRRSVEILDLREQHGLVHIRGTWSSVAALVVDSCPSCPIPITEVSHHVPSGATNPRTRSSHCTYSFIVLSGRRSPTSHSTHWTLRASLSALTSAVSTSVTRRFGSYHCALELIRVYGRSRSYRVRRNSPSKQIFALSFGGTGGCRWRRICDFASSAFCATGRSSPC